MSKNSHYPQPNQSLDFAALEQDVLKFWQENKIFEASVEMRNISQDGDDNVSPVLEPCALKEHADCRHEDYSQKSEFVFYDGPPFANGLPHYGHLLTGFIKDIFARYQTMKGKKVERKFGWDTHGLPVEMETEKELTAKTGKSISGQIAIQEYGIEKFNAACQSSVMKYAGEWRNYVTRQGRFVDFDNSYKTMDINYMESVLWAFKSLYDKNLVYEDFRVMPYSWACQTPVSNFETRMDNAYRQKESQALTVKFELTKIPDFLANHGYNKISLVAWTTTPWTLPSNLALAVGKNIEYAVIKTGDEAVIVAANLIEKFTKDFNIDESSRVTIIMGSKLVGLNYKPLFPYLVDHEKIKNHHAPFSVLHGDFVATDEGTGIVHMAPGFGEDDQMLCKANGIATLCPVDEGGKFTNEIFDFDYLDKENRKHTLKLKGRNVLGFDEKLQYDKENNPNKDVIIYLKATGAWVKTEQYLHNYPHCWRTDTPLIYRAVSSWYVKVTDIKDRMVELNSGKPVLKIDKLPRAIKTDRLHGKIASEENFDDFLRIFSDKEARKYFYFSDTPIYDERHTHEAIECWQYRLEQGLPRFALFDEKNNFVGIAGFAFYDPSVENFETGRVEISYQIDRKHWNQGFATEITKALVDYAFKYYPVDVVCAATVGDNEASKRVLDKCGFKFVRKGHNSYPKGGFNTQYEEYYYELKKTTNTGINWIPDHIKGGQFGKWLEGARDWSITRNRFWGCPVPVWRSTDPQYPRIDVYGSLEELQRDFDVRPTNLHRPYIDELTRLNPSDPRFDKKHPDHKHCSKMQRVTDVLDCWFESGSMPYAQVHYPFENKEWFEQNFPADFITEYVAQTRGWFYTLMVLSTALFDRAPFKNVICHGTILDENAQKLSKRLKNYADPVEVFSTLGADSMRFYMISQPVMRGQELRIDKEGKAFHDTLRLSIKPLINAYNFFCLYANSDGIKAKRIEYSTEFKNTLDLYILAKLKAAVSGIDHAMTNYDTVTACEEFNKFFEALNNWYIRRSRQRFWKSEIDQDKQDAYNVLYTALVTMCEASAPLLPFTTEFVWKGLSSEAR